MLRVLNCSVNEELRSLRHIVLERVAAVEVVSAPPEQAVSALQDTLHDVLVLCYGLDGGCLDHLCSEFRRANPEGRIVGIVSSPWISQYEADVLVDAHSPKALVTAVNSYPTFRAQFQAERRLVFIAKGKWVGWTCERCCWNRPQPQQQVVDGSMEATIRAEFDRHSCEAFARKNWLAASVSE